MKKMYIEPKVKVCIVRTHYSMLAGSINTLGEEITEGNVESEGKDDLDFGW